MQMHSSVTSTQVSVHSVPQRRCFGCGFGPLLGPSQKYFHPNAPWERGPYDGTGENSCSSRTLHQKNKERKESPVPF